MITQTFVNGALEIVQTPASGALDMYGQPQEARWTIALGQIAKLRADPAFELALPVAVKLAIAAAITANETAKQAAS